MEELLYVAELGVFSIGGLQIGIGWPLLLVSEDLLLGQRLRYRAASGRVERTGEHEAGRLQAMAMFIF